MAEDILTDFDGNKLGSDGNYETTITAAGMMVRCFNAKYGCWPGGRGEKFGRKYRGVKKWSTKIQEEFVQDAIASQEPLVEAGLIRDVECEVVESARRDAPRIRLKAYDVQAKDNISVDVDAPWGL